MSRLKSAEQVEALIVRLLREVIPYQFAKKEIRPEMSLQQELGIDSLGKVALAFRLEEQLGVDLSEFSGNIHEIRTVQDMVAATRDLIARAER